jgi:hypothetical protein
VTQKSYFHVRTEENPGIYEPVTPFVSQKMSRKVAKITRIKSEQNGKWLWKEIGLGVRSLRCEDKTVPRDWMGALDLLHLSLQGRDAWRHKTATRLTACPSVYKLYFSIRRYERGCEKGKWTEVKRRIKRSHGTSMGSYTLCCKFFGALLKGGGSEWGQPWVTTSVSCSGAHKKKIHFYPLWRD